MEKRPPLHFSVIATERGAFGSPSTTVTNFTYTYKNEQKIVQYFGTY